MMGRIDLFLLVVGAVTALVDDCPYQVCFCDGAEIMCQGRRLNDIPPIVGTPPDNSKLMLDTNNITRIRAASLPKHLKHFSAFEDPITTIDDSAFSDSISTLQVLQFSKFRFTRIPDAFFNLTNLEYVTIYDGNILDWNIQVMKSIGRTVLSLDLQNVGLTAWPDWIRYFTNLTDLTLDNGGISSVPDNALDMLANSLTSLSMDNNSLMVVPQTVSRLTVLQSLSLYHNNIMDTTWLPHLSHLSTLGLSYNRLFNSSQLNLSLRPFAESLHELNLLGNRLTHVPDLSFLKLIEALDFTYNQLTDPQLGPLPVNMFDLNLGNNFLPRIPGIYVKLPHVIQLLLPTNYITEIRAADFSPWISVVDLSFNHITELTDTSFPPHSVIITLNLNNNPLSTISNNVFNNLLLLTQLTMSNTQITRLPVGLSVLTNINFLAVDGNEHLVCTCLEKSLAAWILSRPSNPDGACGLSSIHDFFYTLSQTCP